LFLLQTHAYFMHMGSFFVGGGALRAVMRTFDLKQCM